MISVSSGFRLLLLMIMISVSSGFRLLLLMIMISVSSGFRLLLLMISKSDIQLYASKDNGSWVDCKI